MKTLALTVILVLLTSACSGSLDNGDTSDYGCSDHHRGTNYHRSAHDDINSSSIAFGHLHVR